MNITGVTNTTYYAGTSFGITVTTNSTGIINLTVNGKSYSVANNTDVTLGMLEAGHYIVTAVVYETENHTMATKSIEFTVVKNTAVVNITGVENITYTAGTGFTVKVITNSTGVINLTVNGKAYSVANDTELAIGMLEAGHYIITAVVYETENHTMATKTVEFTVVKNTAVVNITGVTNTTYYAGTSFGINVTTNSTGIINLTVNGKSYIVSNNTIKELGMLEAGHYIVTAVVYETENHTMATKSIEFTVVKNTALINIAGATNTTYNARKDFTIRVITNSTGVINLTVNGKAYTVSNDTDVALGVLEAGHYIITAVVYETENHTFASTTLEFTVIRAQSLVNVTATDATYGNASEITVTVPKAQTGFVRIIVDGTDINVTVEIINGTAKFNATGLNVGKYHVNVTYLGDDTYYTNVNDTYFNITKANLTADVIGQNVTVEQNTSFIVDVIDDFKGNVTITVDGVKYNGTVKSLIEMARLLAGNKTAHVTFYGDDNYNIKEMDVNFTVSRVDPLINVTIDDVTYPERAIALVNVSNNANGTVEVYFNNTKVASGTVTNGKARVELAQLPGGVHEVTVKFITDDKYNNNITAKAKFEVIRANTTVIITRNGNNVTATVKTVRQPGLMH